MILILKKSLISVNQYHAILRNTHLGVKTLSKPFLLLDKISNN
jgi:hypothetical protein